MVHRNFRSDPNNPDQGVLKKGVIKPQYIACGRKSGGPVECENQNTDDQDFVDSRINQKKYDDAAPQ